MKTRRVGLVLAVSAACLWSGLASGPVLAVGITQELSETAAEIGRVYSIIRQQTGISSGEFSPLPVIGKDPQGKIWAAWEDWEAGRSRIRLASFDSAGIESISTVGGPEGTDLAPDLAFAADGQPWVIWLNSRGAETGVLVLDVAGQRIWRLGGESAASVTSPKIVVDGRGSVWAFWNVTAGSTGEIIYRVLEGQTWTAPASIPRLTCQPAVNPDAGTDGRGTLWLAWSGYDGSRYVIFLTHWTGTRWAREEAISRNRGTNLFPALGFDDQGNPLVCWVRTSDGHRFVCLTSLMNGRAGEELVLKARAVPPAPPRFIRGDAQGSIILKSDDGVRVESARRAFTSDLPAAAPAPPAPRLLTNPQFDESKYAGVGDSITFGYVDWNPYPERGYIPLLNAILNTRYGPHRVINEGLGGEVTAEGLARIDSVFIADLARYILIMEGTNDVIFGDISMDSAAFNLREMVRKCLAVGALPAIATILPRYDWYGTIAVFHNRILSLNAKIRQSAAEMSIPLVDMYAAFEGYPEAQGGVLSLLSRDLKHPSDKGYQFMAETWFSGIRNFPFPPVNLSLETFGPERGDRPPNQNRNRNRTPASSRTSQPDRIDLRQPHGNRLRWAVSPKIFDPGTVLGYRIYRKKPGGGNVTFQFLAFVQEPLVFIDRGVTGVGQFSYAISTLRQDGVEGPVALTDER